MSDGRREQGLIVATHEACLLIVFHAGSAVREDTLKVGKVHPQLAELACDVGQDLLADGAGREHFCKADVAALKNVEE